MTLVVGLLMTACGSLSPPAHATYTLGHFPQVPTGSFSQSTTRALQAVLDDFGNRFVLPGITATVLAADGRAWSGAAGTADGMHPVEVRSQFGIASFTKTVIAAEVMRLSERGLLRLSDPVSEHLPSNFHFDTNGATIRNLLHMESGIPDPALNYTDPVLADPPRDKTDRTIHTTVPAYRLQPGHHFIYENATHLPLSLVIDATTGT